MERSQSPNSTALLSKDGFGKRANNSVGSNASPNSKLQEIRRPLTSNGERTAMLLEDNQNHGNSTDRGTQVGSSRFAQSMEALQYLSSLHKRAISAQIQARQKRRAAGFKRREVWTSDGKFMTELQRLLAEGKMKNFDGAEALINLAEECQIVRDDLGPLEEEGTESEQNLEGEIWKLDKATESTFNEFEKELLTAGMYHSKTSTTSSSEYYSDEILSQGSETQAPGQILANKVPEALDFSSADGFNLVSCTPEPILEAIPQPTQEYSLSGMHTFKGENTARSESGYGDIDLAYGHEGLGESLKHTGSAPPEIPKSLERHPELFADFKTPRDRINRWLLFTTLLSHHEAEMLRGQVYMLGGPPPSNWAQLVIEYWGKDGAATPVKKATSIKDPSTIKGDKKEVQEPTNTLQPPINSEDEGKRALAHSSDSPSVGSNYQEIYGDGIPKKSRSEGTVGCSSKPPQRRSLDINKDFSARMRPP